MLETFSQHIMKTLADILDGGASHAALILAGGGPTVDRQAMKKSILQCAISIRAAGFQPGDVISMAYANTLDFVVAFLGVIAARCVAAPLNAAYKEEEFSFYLEDTSSKLLLLPKEGNKAAEAAAKKHKCPVATLCVSFSPDVNQPQLSITPLSPGLVMHQVPLSATSGLSDPPRPSDLALFFHTSGTTGRPKAVPLTHGNIMASLGNISLTYELFPADRSYLVMPLFHVHGLMAGLLSPLMAGASVILPSEGRFAAGSFWRDCSQHKATFFTAVPTMHQILLSRAAQDYPASNPPPLRFIRSCSASLAAATLEKLEATFKVPVLEAYAMSEASHQMTSNPLPKNGSRKPGSVGKAQGSVKVTVLDEQNRPVAVGKVGEVCIRGPNVTQGYWNNPKANAEAYAGGWFHTGDQGWLDSEGYLTLTGRIKELINRGGEKISPLEVDSCLLSHPSVVEACCFAVPDEKYGEVVAAAVVLRPEAASEGPKLEEAIKKHCAKTLADFKVPTRVFITNQLPKGPTGKIQRRTMAAFFFPKGESSSSSPPSAEEAGIDDGHALTATSIADLGIKCIFGVVGIPVTPLASSAQAAGIRFIGFRNEQSAAYAAACYGFITGQPGVLLTVSGPGAIHGIAGLSHAAINCWPMIQISGACEQSEEGKGAFQECDQVGSVARHTKFAASARTLGDIPRLLQSAYQASVNGRPGPCYVGLPSDVLLSRQSEGIKSRAASLTSIVYIDRLTPSQEDIVAAAAIIRAASRPLVFFGKGALMSEGPQEGAQRIVNLGLPFLCSSMGRGLLPEKHPLCMNPARSLALAKADVALIVGARLNWQLHFGESPKWSSDCKFILIDIEPSQRDVSKASVLIQGDAGVSLDLLHAELASNGGTGTHWGRQIGPWTQQLTAQRDKQVSSLTSKLSKVPPVHLDYHAVFAVIRRELMSLSPEPMVVSEGANTMDMARLCLSDIIREPKTRIDAATWGTMGIGLGAAIASAVARPDRITVAIEGDSAFGFSGMELETMVRYKLPIVVIVMNNGGIYGGDRRASGLQGAAEAGLAKSGLASDPAPTAFVPDSRYDLMMKAFHGKSYRCSRAHELQDALSVTLREARLPCLIDVILDPLAGVESGNVHSFNLAKI